MAEAGQRVVHKPGPSRRLSGRTWGRLTAFAFMFVLVAGEPLVAAPRILPAGKLPADARLAPPKDLDGYFPFQPPATPEQRPERAAFLRRQLLVSLG